MPVINAGKLGTSNENAPQSHHSPVLYAKEATGSDCPHEQRSGILSPSQRDPTRLMGARGSNSLPLSHRRLSPHRSLGSLWEWKETKSVSFWIQGPHNSALLSKPSGLTAHEVLARGILGEVLTFWRPSAVSGKR